MASAKMVVKATTFFMVLIIMTGASLRSVVDAMRVRYVQMAYALNATQRENRSRWTAQEVRILQRQRFVNSCCMGKVVWRG